MTFKLSIGSTLAIFLVAASVPARSATTPEGYAAHHPTATASAPSLDAGRFGQQMQTMQVMHQRMLSAKTPDERAALMGEHMKAMQDGMAMMSQMGGEMPMGGMGMWGMGTKGMGKDGSAMPMHKGERSSEHESMRRRMDMMQMMMQMMMDRQAALPAGVK